jgi:hypothetical protein
MKSVYLLSLATVLLVSLISIGCGGGATPAAIAWTKTFGGSGNDHGHSVRQTSDGGYVIAGSTYSYGAGNADVWLIRVDSSGNTAWDKTLGGSNSDYGWSVQQTSDRGYIIVGYTDSYGAGGYDIWLMKITA